MDLNIKQSTQNINEIDVFSYTEETIHLFNHFMSDQYAKKLNIGDLEDKLAKFYDGLIWAQKKNPLLIYQMFQMKALHQIIDKYLPYSPVMLLRNNILLIGNCQPKGLVAEQLVQSQYPHFLLNRIFGPQTLGPHKEEIGQYMGNFLKCYHRLFNEQWLNKFTLDGHYFQLFEINLKYFNCPDLMARTNALNIVLDLLHFDNVRQFILNCESRRAFYTEYFTKMTQQFRNQLAEFGLRISHASKQDNVQYVLTQLQDKISLWLDFSNNFKDIQFILEIPFIINVILPLVIGPLEVKDIPTFTLKFSLFVIKKLIPIMKNLKILQFYIRIIFIQQKVYYQPNSLRKAIIEPFQFQKLLIKQIKQVSDEQKSCCENVKTFYMNFLKSKDNHFILMKNSLVCSLFKHGQSCSEISKQYGLHYGGQLYNQVCRILLSQLRDVHQLTTIQSLLNTLILINNGKSLETQLQNEYLQICNHLISQLKSGLNLSKDKNVLDNISYLAEIVQYDINSIHKVVLGSEKEDSKFENIFKIVFVWQILKEQINLNYFYSKIPDSPVEYLRYLMNKFLLFRKARKWLTDGHFQDSLLEHYYSMMVIQCPYIEGDLYKQSQIQQQLERCQLIQQKSTQQVILIKDPNFFAMAKPNGERVQIIYGVKIKHMSFQEIKKKKKIVILLNQYKSQTKQLVQKDLIQLKWSESVVNYLRKYRDSSIIKNIMFIKQCLQKTQAQLPAPSLL